MQVYFIDTQSQLTEICQQFSGSHFLALDTEFIRQATYYPILALVQICDGQQIAIIDPIALHDLSPLMTLLYNKKIVKVIHSARQDMEIFYHLNQSIPDTLFDTQISAALLGYGEQIGYATLVKQLLNIDLDKSQTRTDWLKRPLSQKQIDYAANDVRYLAQLYPLQQQKLQQLGRTTWLEKDFQFLSKTSTYAPSLETIWKKIKGVKQLKKQNLAILKNLATFREQLAISQNRPRRRVISDELLIELSIQHPTQLDELRHYKNLSQQLLHHHSHQLLALIQKGLQTENEECPQFPIYKKLSQNEEALAHCLMTLVHISAQKNHISPNALCSRKEIDSLIQGQRELTMLTGWKNELIGQQLLNFLSGKIQISYQQGQLLLT
jgi:ribonuclease D